MCNESRMCGDFYMWRDLSWYGLAVFGFFCFGRARAFEVLRGLVWPGLCLRGLAWLGLAWLGLAWPGQARPGLAWHSQPRLGMTCAV